MGRIVLFALTLLLAWSAASGAEITNRIPLPTSQPSGLAWDGDHLYLSNLIGFRTIHRLDPADGTVVGEFLAPSATGLDGRGNPNGLAYDGGGSLFVTDIGEFGAGRVFEIDRDGRAILGSFELPFRGGGIAWDGRDLYIADFDSDLILVTDRLGVELRRFRSGLRPAGMTVEPRSGHLLIISEFDDRITELTADGEIVRTCVGPREPGVQGLGAVVSIDGRLAIAEVTDPDPFGPPELPGTLFVVPPQALCCEAPGSDECGARAARVR